MESTATPWHFSDDAVRVGRLVAGSLDNNVFLLACAATHEAIVIDAAANPSAIVAMTADHRVKAIVTTHGHWDHVGAAAAVSTALDVPILIGEADAAMAKLATWSPLEPGPLPVGELEVEVIATPGHTPGSHCLRVGELVFTGDTLFPGGPGATRSPTEFKEIMRSLDERLFTLPDATMVLPGHGLDTTIGAERPFIEEWRARGW